MISNYLLSTARNIKRDYSYAVINITGLAVGLSCFILLALYLESELSYDRHYDNHENIYRFVQERSANGQVDLIARASGLVPPVLTQTYPEMVDFVRFRPASASSRLILRHDDTSLYWGNVYLADDNLFQVFSHNIIYGDPINGLVDPTTIAISETVSRAYFGDENPIGESLATDTASYTVAVVYEDLPDNTHLKHNAILSYNRLAAFNDNNNVVQGAWNTSDFNYVLMQDGYQRENFSAISQAFYDEYMIDIGTQNDMSMNHILEPLAQIHLNSETQRDFPRGNRFYLFTFATIGIMVLLIACINYLNLATVKSIRRAKEVGMRKVLGAEKRQIIGQFLSESILFSCAAVILATLLVLFALNFTGVESLLGTELNFSLLDRPELALMLITLAIVVGILSGLYPAFYLSAISPAAAFQNQKGSRQVAVVRQVLVFLQFVISVGVISCTLIMVIQMQFMQDRPLGFDKENVLVVTLRGADLIESIPLIRADLSSDPRVIDVALAQNIPGQTIDPWNGELESELGDRQVVDMNLMYVGEGFLDTMAWVLI